MVAIHDPSYRPIGMTLPIESVRIDRVCEWIGMTVRIDGMIEFRFFWLDHIDWILPIGLCMAVGDWQFSSGDLRNAALDKLLSKYKEIDAEANRDAVLKKINSLRTAYQKERKKVEESKRSGAGADAVYVPKLWYYKELSFINDQNVARTSVSNVDENEESADEEQQIEQQHLDIDNNSQPNEILIQPNEESDNDGSVAGNSARRPKPKRKNEDNLVNSVLQSVNDHFKRPRDEVRKEDRHDIYCKSIASKLRDLPRQQRMLAEKLMNDVLFEAEWGNLTLDYKVINTGPRHRRYATSPSNNFSPSYQITSPSHSSHSASPSPNMQHHQQTVSPSYPFTSPSHSSHSASPSPNMQHHQQTVSSSYPFTSPSHSSHSASPSPNMQHHQQTVSPSYPFTSPSHSSHSASPSQNMQHNQQTVSPSYPITSHSHSSLQNVQDDLHFSQRHEAPGPEDLPSISGDSAASFVGNFMSE
ncbi:hypothetical protein evm_010238 [Chilo suppressalis]|nr:hypothetical protein evm_010238 [Chilo suppressalis]